MLSVAYSLRSMLQGRRNLRDLWGRRPAGGDRRRHTLGDRFTAFHLDARLTLGPGIRPLAKPETASDQEFSRVMPL